MLQEIIHLNMTKLSLSQKIETLHFIETLAKQKVKENKKIENFKFNWEGSLKSLSNEYNSVELQHKALEYR